MNSEKQKRPSLNLKDTILIAVIVLLAVVSVFFIGKYIQRNSVNDSELINAYADEISRAKFFIKDWYAEISGVAKSEQVYHNELRFDGGNYTLTVADKRIRAVYPRGERYFKLEYISYIEFFETSGKLQCRLYYEQNGEYTFTLRYN